MRRSMKLPGRSVIKKQVGIGSGQLKNDDKKKMITKAIKDTKTGSTLDQSCLDNLILE